MKIMKYVKKKKKVTYQVQIIKYCIKIMRQKIKFWLFESQLWNKSKFQLRIVYHVSLCLCYHEDDSEGAFLFWSFLKFNLFIFIFWAEMSFHSLKLTVYIFFSSHRNIWSNKGSLRLCGSQCLPADCGCLEALFSLWDQYQDSKPDNMLHEDFLKSFICFWSCFFFHEEFSTFSLKKGKENAQKK